MAASTIVVSPKYDFIGEYVSWLKDQMSIKDINGYVEIITPYLDKNNDKMVIYAQISGNEIKLTDDGSTIDELIMSGCDLSTPNRKAYLNSIVVSYGIQCVDDVLLATTTRAGFPQKKHMMLQAMMAIGDMFLSQRSHAASFFFDDVAKFFESNRILFEPRIQYTGKSGFNQMFDFVIPRQAKPSRVVKLLSSSDKSHVENVLFAFRDIAEIKPDINMNVILNDFEKKIAASALDAFANYNVNLYPWSLRDSISNSLMN